MAADSRPDWRMGTVVSTELVAENTKRITIQRPPSARAQPGAHIDVQVDLGDRTDHRSYSAVSSNSDGSLITITVLRTRNSRGGSLFMHRLEAGDQLLTTQPLQNFPLRVGAPRYVVVAGGIGITAVIAMAELLKLLRCDYTFVYVARSRAAMAYFPELHAVHGERLQIHLDNEGSPLDVAGLVADITAGGQSHSTELYMCGPIRLMDAIRREWVTARLPIYNLRYETFGNSGWFEPQEFVVRIPRLGVETTVGTHTTVLEALTEAGVELMFDCRKGECGLCAVDVLGLDGQLDHRDVYFSDSQRQAGTQFCTCVSRAVSPGDADGIGGSRVHAPGGAGSTGRALPILTIDVS
jgi:ferredoxin-NADP reductase